MPLDSIQANKAGAGIKNAAAGAGMAPFKPRSQYPLGMAVACRESHFCDSSHHVW